ncbi:MAG: YcaO-like family protein [Geminicoccaceae bacterium]
MGTHRSATPEETLARLEALLPALGITRLANITGLDCIGIPVYMACRPNSRSLAVFQGKGIEPAAAKVSAAMEAVETFHAESIDLPLKLASYEELRYTHAVADIARLPFSRDGLFDPMQPILWIEGEDLLSGIEKWLPFELVHANYTLPSLTGSGSFAATTNGLASGNHILEALCHALYEVIERDAVTLWRLAGEDHQRARRLDAATIDDPACRQLLEQLMTAGIDVVVWDVTSDIGVPTYLCLIAGRSEATGAPEFGAGSHLCRDIALARALTEAAQARTTYIAGSREDITAAHYASEAREQRFATAREIVEEQAPGLPFDQAPTYEFDGFEHDLDAVLSALAAVGIEEVLAVDLTKPNLRIPVVRVVVPGLEGALDGPDADYVPGLRAMRLLESRP